MLVRSVSILKLLDNKKGKEKEKEKEKDKKKGKKSRK